MNDSRRGAVVAAALTLVFFYLGLCWLHTEARYTIPARLLLWRRPVSICISRAYAS